MKAKKTKIIANKNNNLHVVEWYEGGASQEENLFYTPIVAWVVVVDAETPETSWATPITVDLSDGGQSVVVDRTTMEWWEFGNGSGKGLESLISHFSKDAA